MVLALPYGLMSYSDDPADWVNPIKNAVFGDQTGFDPNRQDLGLTPTIADSILRDIMAAKAIPAYDSEAFADWATVALNNYYLTTNQLVQLGDVPVGTSMDVEALAASEAAAQAARWGRC